MAQIVKLQFLRGIKAQIDSASSTDIGKPFFATDTKEVFVSDGSTKYLVGKAIVDIIANRPTAGVQGRVFVSTNENNKMYVDNGSIWVVVGITDLADMSGDLDDIADGATFGKVANTELTTDTTGEPVGAIKRVRAETANVYVSGDTINTHIGASSGVHGIVGSVVGTTDSQSISNKTLGSDLNANNNKITNLATPTIGTDAVNKTYVDGRLQGLDTKESVRVATTSALPSNTPSGIGIGKLLTATVNGVLSIDGISSGWIDIDTDGGVNNPLEPTSTRATRVLVKNQASSIHNGIYVVKAKGSAGTPWILVRAIDFDENSEVTNNAYTFVAEGTTNANAGFSVTTLDTIVVDSTGITWTQFNGAGNILAGNGLTKSGNTIDVVNNDGSITVNTDEILVNVDDVTIENGTQTGASGIQVKDGGINEDKLSTSVAGDGLVGGNGTPLSVNVGNGLEIVADAVRVKVDSITGGTSANVIKTSANGTAVGIDNASIKVSGNNLYVFEIDGGTLP